MESSLKCVCAVTALAVTCTYVDSGIAQEAPSAYPTKPVKIVIPLGPGNSIEIVQRLNHETRVALNSADVQARMTDFGFEIYGSSSEQFSDVVKADVARMASLIKQAGIKPQ